MHRYAITFHRQKRSNKTFGSIFDSVKGMGVKRIKKLWEIYDSIEDVRKDSVKSIYSKTNIPIDICKELKRVIKK